MRSERGNGGAFLALMLMIWMWWMVIIFVVILPASYDSEKECLEEWSKCDQVSETWEPTDNAEEKP